MRRYRLTGPRALAGLVLSLLVLTPPAGAAPSPGGTFVDDDGSVHEPFIEAISAAGITVGCDATRVRFCPNAPVTRGQAATLITRGLGLPTSTKSWFADTAHHPHAAGINSLRQAGITAGCDGAGRRFCPDATLTRGQMASLLDRALKLRPAKTDFFRDDAGSAHEAAINRLRQARVTLGCTADGGSFCPNQQVSRGEMATFLGRAMGLAPPAVPPRYIACHLRQP